MLKARISATVAVLICTGAIAQPPARTAIDPNNPEGTRKIVPRAERECLGLNERTWSGVVHPDVSKVLAQLSIKPKDPVNRIQMKFRQRLEGSVYVQVHLKHVADGRADSEENRTAISEAQQRVLDSLTSAEFHVVQELKDSPGMLGYANEAALQKLQSHPEVLGVCLDDKPMGEQLPIVTVDDLPPAVPGEKASAPGVAEHKVTPDVYRALDQSDRVFVLVALNPKDKPLPKLTDEQSESLGRWESREQAARALQDRVLSTLTADDFWLVTRLGGSPGFGGYVTIDGLRKLLAHPELRSIGLERMMHTMDLPSSR